MSVLGIIPARYGSTRFPGKPLAMIGDKTMIHRTYDQVLKSSLDAVVVATDDRRIYDEVVGFGGRAVMTRADHRSGTDRCREALEALGGGYDGVVNVQGDEPFIDPRQIDQVAELLRCDGITLATLARRIQDPSALDNPNVVKVVFDRQGDALYFSRHPLPYLRGVERSRWLEQTAYYRHIGLYAYSADTLRRLADLSPGRLETAESLEQLRWLENGLRIRVAVTDLDQSLSIDTPDDLLSIPKEALL
ncbi:MAG: 3-deoxy-manno-octulosonate cytidylyltransferase [Bacteroidales bacterium]|nr:3-deoxy-manno-octulosonate cytidylyltransferase [Bacteroidales bacterium]